MNDWFSWMGVLVAVLELGILLAAYLVSRRYLLTHPIAVRLVTRAIVVSGASQLIALVVPYLHVYDSVNTLQQYGPVDWHAALFNAGVLKLLLFQWTLSALYAYSLWLIAYAALAKPDLRPD